MPGGHGDEVRRGVRQVRRAEVLRRLATPYRNQARGDIGSLGSALLGTARDLESEPLRLESTAAAGR